MGRTGSGYLIQEPEVCLAFMEHFQPGAESWSVYLAEDSVFLCLSGGDLNPLELADVNGDGLRDVLLSFVTLRNGSTAGKRGSFGGWCLPSHCWQKAFAHFFSFFLSLFFRATPVAYGGSQARGRIGATAAGHSHSHSHARPEPCLQPTQLMAMLDP